MSPKVGKVSKDRKIDKGKPKVVHDFGLFV